VDFDTEAQARAFEAFVLGIKVSPACVEGEVAEDRLGTQAPSTPPRRTAPRELKTPPNPKKQKTSVAKADDDEALSPKDAHFKRLEKAIAAIATRKI